MNCDPESNLCCNMSGKLRLPGKLRSSLVNDSVHCKLKLIQILYNERNYTKLQVRATTMTRTCTGNCWNSYEFRIRWILEFLIKCPDADLLSILGLIG
jgi:hypothetical protein